MVLREQHCTPLGRDSLPLAPDTCQQYLSQLDAAWSIDANGHVIRREFCFDDFYQTMAFVNAIAWIAHREDHHPQLQVGYNKLVVEYTTHTIEGLMENDFICAAHIDQLLLAT